MASISGIWVKDMMRDEESDIFSGTVMYHKRELGDWESSLGGDVDAYTFDEHELDNVVEQYRQSALCDAKYKKTATLDYIMDDLIQLELAQLTFIEANEAAAEPMDVICVRCTDGKETQYEYMTVPDRRMKEAQIEITDAVLDAIKSRYEENFQVRLYGVYKTEDDFDIEL